MCVHKSLSFFKLIIKGEFEVPYKCKVFRAGSSEEGGGGAGPSKIGAGGAEEKRRWRGKWK